MKFKLISLTIILSMLFGCINFFPVQGEELTVGQELIENGGFESLDSEGHPTGDWKPFKGWEAGYVHVENSTVHEGKNSIKLENEAGNVCSWYRFRVTNVLPNASYDLSAMVNYNLQAGGNGLMLYTEYYSNDTADDPTSFLSYSMAARVEGSSNNQWTPMKGTVTAVEGTKMMLVYIITYSPGTVYVDNVSAKFSDGPEPYSFFTDQTFYYPEDKQGLSMVEINSFYKPDEEEYTATVDFELTDGDKVLKAQSKTPFNPESRKAEFLFDISLLSELETRYDVTATVKSSAGETIKKFSDEVYCFNRPANLRADGTIIKDGKPYHATLAYWPLEDIGKMKEIGINCAYITAYDVESTLEKLDKLQEHGMTAIVALYVTPVWLQPTGHPGNLPTAKKIVEGIKGHPAIIAYDMCDEPIGNKTPGSEEFNTMVRYLIDGYKGIHEVDKEHPIYSVDFYPPNYKYSQKYCDIFSADIYTFGDTIHFSTAVKEGVTASAGRKPTWGIVQTYENSTDYGLPRIWDVRGCIYRGLEVGIQGTGYYSLLDAIGQVGGKDKVNLDHTELWEPLSDFAQKEQPELFKYYMGKEYRTFNKNEDGDYHSFYYESWINGNDIWMVLHNRGNDTINAKAPLISNNGLVRIIGAKAEAVGGTDKNVDITGNTLEVVIAPQEVYLYKITPNSSVDYSKVSVEVENPIQASETDKKQGTFSDLDGYEWAGKEIEALYDLGIVNQTTVYTYSPSTFVTRGDFARFLVKTLNLYADTDGNFTDVPEGAPYEKETAILKALGISDGTGDGRFRPEEPISRQDMLKIAARGMRLSKKLPETANHDVLNAFSDKEQIAGYAIGDVAAMVEAGIIAGDENKKINPASYTTRAEAAVIMYKILNTEEIKTETPSPSQEMEVPEIVFEEEALSEAQTAERADAAQMLKSLGIFEAADFNAALTRAETAKLISKILMSDTDFSGGSTVFTDVPADSEYAGYIAAVKDLGLMSGFEDNTFKPNEAVTYHQLIKILVDILGYKAYAGALGGYPAGYLSQGVKLKLTEGLYLSRDYPVRASAAALLIKNALDAKIALVYNYGSGGKVTFEIDKEETLLSYYLDIKKYTGQITGTKMQVIKAPRLLKDGEIAMGDTVFNAGTSGAEKLLGYKATVYAKEDKTTDTKLIVYAEGSENVSALKINAANILPVSENTSKLYYTDENGKESSVSIEGSASVLYNGMLKENWKAADFYIKSGQLTLISANGGGFGTVLIEEYENRQIDQVSILKDTIYFTDGTDINLDNSKSVKTEFIDSTGKSVTLKECEKGDIISVFKSGNGSTLKLILSKQKVTGYVTEIDDDNVTLQDISYKISTNVKEKPDIYGEMKLNLKAVFYLDYCKNVAAADSGAQRPLYGYLAGMSREKGLDSTISLKIFSAAGKMEHFKLAEKVEYNGGKTSAAEIYEKPEFIGTNGSFKQQLVIYDTNAGGDIIILKTARDGSHMAEDDRLAEFTMDVLVDSKSSPDNTLARYIGYQQKTLGDYYRYDGGTVFFSVPDTVMEDKYYNLLNMSSVTVGWLEYPVSFYDIDEDLVISAVVSISKASGTAPDSQSTPAVITGFTKAINEDGEEVMGIMTYTQNPSSYAAEERILYIDKNADVVVDSYCLSTEWKGAKPKSISASELNPGDIIQYKLNSKTGMINAIRVILRGETPKLNDELADDGVGKYYGGSGLEFVCGEVLRKLSNGALIKNQYVGRPYLWYDSNLVPTPIILLEKDDSGKYTKSSVITGDDVFKGDIIFGFKVSGIWPKLYVVYR